MVKSGDKIRVIKKDYVGAYEMGDTFVVTDVLNGDGSAGIIVNDGKKYYLWTDEFEVLEAE